MFIVDASVYVAVHSADDPKHQLCADWLESCLSQRARLSAPVLLMAEVSAAIRRLTGDCEEAERICTDMLADREMELFPLTVERGREAARVAAIAGVRGADAVYLALARELEAPLITLDRQQLERGKKVATVSRPSVS